MPRALITGITGQDGSYLAEFLLDRGYEVLPAPHTLTCVPPASEQWHDAGGWCVIALSLTWLSWEPAASLIPGAVAGGLVEEIAAEEFWAAAPQPEL